MYKHESFRFKVLFKLKLLSEFIVKGCEKFRRMLFASRFYGIHGCEILAHFHVKNVCGFYVLLAIFWVEYISAVHEIMKYSEECQIFL